jgi:flagellar hook-basal body complex protein FliE
MQIDAIASTALQPGAKLEPQAEAPAPTSFLDVLERARETEQAADTASARFAAGDPDVGIHEVVIAAEKAAISVRYATTLKNRVLEAYRELMNTPV